MSIAETIFKNLKFSQENNLDNRQTILFVGNIGPGGNGYNYPKQKQIDSIIATIAILTNSEEDSSILPKLDELDELNLVLIQRNDPDRLKCKFSEFVKILKTNKFTVSVSRESTITISSLESAKAA